MVVTQVCPGPVDSEFDQVAGSAGGMTGGPPQFLRISAAQCAREALAGFDRGVPLVFPGRAYRIPMRALPLLPRELSRRQAAHSSLMAAWSACLASNAAARPDPVERGLGPLHEVLGGVEQIERMASMAAWMSASRCRSR